MQRKAAKTPLKQWLHLYIKYFLIQEGNMNSYRRQREKGEKLQVRYLLQ